MLMMQWFQVLLALHFSGTMNFVCVCGNNIKMIKLFMGLILFFFLKKNERGYTILRFRFFYEYFFLLLLNILVVDFFLLSIGVGFKLGFNAGYFFDE